MSLRLRRHRENGDDNHRGGKPCMRKMDTHFLQKSIRKGAQ